MNLPDPFRSTPWTPYANGMRDDEYRAYLARDGQVRMHNLARHVAKRETTADRAAFLKGMERFHAPVFMARFKRLMARYWKRQRAMRRLHEQRQASNP